MTIKVTGKHLAYAALTLALLAFGAGFLSGYRLALPASQVAPNGPQTQADPFIASLEAELKK